MGRCLEAVPVADLMDGPGFMERVEAQLEPIAPIMTFAIRKQLSDLNATAATLTPEVARRFIERIVGVLRTFAPSDRVEEIRSFLLREFRKAAPRYSEQLLYGGT